MIVILFHMLLLSILIFAVNMASINTFEIPFLEISLTLHRFSFHEILLVLTPGILSFFKHDTSQKIPLLNLMTMWLCFLALSDKSVNSLLFIEAIFWIQLISTKSQRSIVATSLSLYSFLLVLLIGQGFLSLGHNTSWPVMIYFILRFILPSVQSIFSSSNNSVEDTDEKITQYLVPLLTWAIIVTSSTLKFSLEIDLIYYLLIGMVSLNLLRLLRVEGGPLLLLINFVCTMVILAMVYSVSHGNIIPYNSLVLIIMQIVFLMIFQRKFEQNKPWILAFFIALLLLPLFAYREMIEWFFKISEGSEISVLLPSVLVVAALVRILLIFPVLFVKKKQVET